MHDEGYPVHKGNADTVLIITVSSVVGVSEITWGVAIKCMVVLCSVEDMGRLSVVAGLILEMVVGDNELESLSVLE